MTIIIKYIIIKQMRKGQREKGEEMHALHVDGIEGHLEESSISKEERRIEAHNNDTGGEQGLGVHLMEQSTMRLVCWGSRNGPPPSCPMRLSQCTSD